MDTEVRRDVLAVECPSREVLARVGEKWTMRVLLLLESGTHRFTGIRQAMSDVTPKVLTSTLRALERDGLVSRAVFAEVPPRVEYRLTPLGVSLVEALQGIRRWSETHVEEILAARDRADDLILAPSGR